MEIDYRKPECPYCHQSLKKIPYAKTKCPHCGEFMFVRTRPKDRARVVVTKIEADKIEKEWAVHTYYDPVATAKRMEDFIQNSLDTVKNWQALGIKEFKCITSGRNTVCQFCADQHGKIVSLDKAKIGLNLPPFYGCLNYQIIGCCCGFSPILKKND